jgi:hypothetical protein
MTVLSTALLHERFRLSVSHARFSSPNNTMFLLGDPPSWQIGMLHSILACYLERGDTLHDLIIVTTCQWPSIGSRSSSRCVRDWIDIQIHLANPEMGLDHL